MTDNSREAIGEDTNSHVLTLDQSTTANNNNVGNAKNVLGAVIFI